MTECQRISIKHRKVCTGDLRFKIQLFDRDIDAVTSGVDLDISFANPLTKWAALKTVNGIEAFDSTNLSDNHTHIFYIRYMDGIDSQKFVLYKSKYYRINDSENIDERDEYIALFCTERGDSTRKVNFS